MVSAVSSLTEKWMLSTYKSLLYSGENSEPDPGLVIEALMPYGWSNACVTSRNTPEHISCYTQESKKS